ncbi:MAG: N-acetylneuraminate synthase [Fimbriimonadaceae bacterium]|nr:N-acetylneuraminate synthase [Fimbriimonadaceae bacterium]
MKPPFGEDQPCFIIAEAGVNHNGDLSMAKQLIDVAAVAGADAVKFQTFRAESLVTEDAPLADYMTAAGEQSPSQADLLRRLELPLEAFHELKEYCELREIKFMSTAFDEESADALDAMGMDVVKVPSGELTNIPFLRHLASKKRATILSTGMGTLEEVQEALDALEGAGAGPVAILHCVSAYPAPPSAMNLRAMDTMRKAMRKPVGLSDHSEGITIALAAVAMGACVIEKHFTLDRNLPGPDHAASLEPPELRDMVAQIRAVESALGDGIKQPTEAEMNTRDVARRSVALAKSCEAGHVLTPADLILRRPGTGIPPREFDQLVGKRLARDVGPGTQLKWSDVE